MKYIFLFTLFFFSSYTISAQDVNGYWVGIITEGHEQFKFEINIQNGSRKDPIIMGCRSCKRLHGDIVDHRETEKIIDFYGIINADRSINLLDSKLAFKEKYAGEIRTRYQIGLEMKGGESWLVGYYQDYNSKGRKVKQGRIYLKREKIIAGKA